MPTVAPRNILFCPVPSSKWQQFVSILLFMGSFSLGAITFNGNRAHGVIAEKCQHKSNAHWDEWQVAREARHCVRQQQQWHRLFVVVYVLSFGSFSVRHQFDITPPRPPKKYHNLLLWVTAYSSHQIFMIYCMFNLVVARCAQAVNWTLIKCNPPANLMTRKNCTHTNGRRHYSNCRSRKQPMTLIKWNGRLRRGNIARIKNCERRGSA